MDNGSLMTPKHDPNNLGVTYNSFRTVLSDHLANNLDSFVVDGQFSVTGYTNTNPNHSPEYYVIEPFANSRFNIPASGVTSNSPTATSVVDRLVVVSGYTDGWHMFGEDSTKIQEKYASGKLAVPVVLRGENEV